MCVDRKIPYGYAAFPMFFTVVNATFLLRKRKKSDNNLIALPPIMAGWEKNLRFRMLLRKKCCVTLLLLCIHLLYYYSDFYVML